MRGSGGPDVYDVARDARARTRPGRRSGIRIDIETWEVAARDVQTDTMSALEQVARREELDRHRIDLPSPHRRRFLPGIAISGPQHAVGQIHREPLRVVLGRRVDIDELRSEVGVGTIGGDPQPDPDWTGHLESLRKGRRLEREYIAARFE